MLAVLRRPGVLPLFLLNLLARLPMGALALLLILQTEERSGSYAAGGVVAGAYVLTLGLSAPALARLVDRRGQAIVLRGGAPPSAAAVVGLALLPASGPVAVAVVLAAVAGALQPPSGACLRALWPGLVPDDDDRHAAYALESVALEFVYILGPVAIVGGLGALSLLGAMLACAAFQLTGNVAFSLHPSSRSWRPVTGTPRDLRGALRGPGVRVLVGVFAVCGLAVGAVEVVVAAAVGGDEGRTGLLLGAWGLGSMAAGVAVARLGAGGDAPRRLGLLVAAWGATHAVVGLAGSGLVLAAVLLVAGATIAPTFVTANGLLDGVAPDGTMTEAFTWTSTGLNAGAAAGSMLAGVLVDAASPALAMGLLGGVGVLGGLVLLRGDQRSLRPAYA